MWASTLCPLVSSTRKNAFGRASTTVPSISMTPSFLAMSSAIVPGVSTRARGAGRAGMVLGWLHGGPPRRTSRGARSEEHTSELQSRQYLVCRLLLEKKKQETNHQLRYEYITNLV